MGYDSRRHIKVTLNEKEKETCRAILQAIAEMGDQSIEDANIATHIKTTAKYGVTIADKVLACIKDLEENDLLEYVQGRGYGVYDDGNIEYDEDLTHNYDDGGLETMIAYALEPGHFGYSKFVGEDGEQWGYCFGRTSENKVYMIPMHAETVFYIEDRPENPIPKEIKKWAEEEHI